MLRPRVASATPNMAAIDVSSAVRTITSTNDIHQPPSVPAVVPFSKDGRDERCEEDRLEDDRDDEREHAAGCSARQVEPDTPWLPCEQGRDRAGAPFGAGDRRTPEHPTEQQEHCRDEHGAVGPRRHPPVGQHGRDGGRRLPGARRSSCRSTRGTRSRRRTRTPTSASTMSTRTTRRRMARRISTINRFMIRPPRVSGHRCRSPSPRPVVSSRNRSSRLRSSGRRSDTQWPCSPSVRLIRSASDGATDDAQMAVTALGRDTGTVEDGEGAG